MSQQFEDQENLNNYQQQNQKSIQNFFDNEFLSDITVTETTTGKSYKMHKLALASKSSYFYELFQQNQEQKQLELPKFVQSTFQQNEFTVQTIDSVLKNFYSVYATPLEGFVKGGLERNNCFVFLSVAKSLGMREAQFVIQNYITQHLKNDSNNAFGMLKDGIKLENEEIIKMSRNLISNSFSNLVNKKHLSQQLNQIPYEEFVNLISSNSLKVNSENDVLKSVQNYIEYCELLPENPDLEYEKKDEKKDEKVDEKKEEKQDEKKEENPAQAEGEKKEEGNKHIFEKDQDEEAQKKLRQFKLNEEQKLNLLDQVRLHYVTNDQLLIASQNPIFAGYKDQFLKSISNKLQEIENPGHNLSVQPRDSYKQQAQNSLNQLIQSRNSIVSPLKQQSKLNVIDESQKPSSNIMSLGFDSKAVDHGYGDHTNPKKQKQGQQSQQLSQQQLLQLQQQLYQNQLMGSFPQLDREFLMQQLSQGQSPSNFSGQHDNRLGQGFNFKQGDDDRNKQYSMVQLHEENPYFQQQQQQRSNSDANIFSNQLEFKYDRDYDQNGVFYYLGTLGRTQQFQNPHQIGQCKVFFSSVRTGRIEDFVGRSVTNLSTNNEKHSFMAVDLGKDRYLFPTSYTIRNRNSTTHICFNWCLEGSNNGKDWYVLDKRINFSESNSRFNQMMDNERQMLMQRGATTTWGIDTTALNKFFEKNYQLERGFRMFKITQLFENSHSTDNLCLSGLELYGRANGGRWRTFD